MSEASKRLRRRRDAKHQLSGITSHRETTLVIHYSCQSFHDRPNGESPRVTSIAVRNFASGRTTSFSIHQIAERDKKFSVEDINHNYDGLEKKMLKEFYEFAEKHAKHHWVHWNMRDINYGFPALEHRYRVLGGKPYELPETNLHDLARILVGLYGGNYAPHPRLASLVTLNSISDLDFLNGQEEADAFESGDYVKLHLSTLRKVDILANITDQAADGVLKTAATIPDIYGNYFAFAIYQIQNHWLIALLSLISTIAGLVALVTGD